MTMSFRSRITGFLTCATVGLAFVSARFARTVLLGLLERSGLDAHLSGLTAFSLGVTRPVIWLAILLVCLAAVVVGEAILKTEVSRLLVQVAILVVLGSLIAVVLAGFLMPFYIPNVVIK